MAAWLPPFWAEEIIEIRYRTGGSYYRGIWTENPATIINAVGVFVDMPENQLRQLGYGQQLDEFVKVYIRLEDYEIIKPYININVTIVKDGKSYKVVSSTGRDKILPHGKLIAQRQNSKD